LKSKGEENGGIGNRREKAKHAMRAMAQKKGRDEKVGRGARVKKKKTSDKERRKKKKKKHCSARLARKGNSTKARPFNGNKENWGQGHSQVIAREGGGRLRGGTQARKYNKIDNEREKESKNRKKSLPLAAE